MVNREPAKGDDTPKLYTQLGLALSIPTLLAAGPLVGFGLGWLIRHWTGWGEWVTWVMVLLGIVAGIRETVLVIRRLS